MGDYKEGDNVWFLSYINNGKNMVNVGMCYGEISYFYEVGKEKRFKTKNGYSRPVEDILSITRNEAIDALIKKLISLKTPEQLTEEQVKCYE